MSDQNSFSYPDQERDKGKKGRRIAGIGVLLVFLALSAGTQHFAYTMGKNRLSGELCSIGGFRIYAPFQVLEWAAAYQQRTGHVKPFMTSLILLGVGTFAGLGLIGYGVRSIAKKDDMKHLHGSARFADKEQIQDAGLMADAGVYVGGFFDHNTGILYYLRHNGREHVLIVAPTRAGKGVVVIIPSLLGWQESMVVLDIKGENWGKTAGYRQSAGHRVIRWDPADAIAGRSAPFNPLEEIRIGTVYETGDIMNVAQMLVDTDGKGIDDNHWLTSARDLLTGAITHVLYRARNDGITGNLADVLYEFNKPGQSFKEETILEWSQYEHAREGEQFYDSRGDVIDSRTHPIVAGAASAIASTPDDEAGSIISTARNKLGLFADPVIARNCSRSSFRLTDIMDHEKPVSLYLVLNPTNLKRLRPLIRLFLAQMLFALMPEMKSVGADFVPPYKHRLVMLLDEFASLGKIEIFQEALAYMGGWNIMAYLVAQDISQIHNAYGKDESITSNCHITSIFTPKKIETARMFSDMVGVTTVPVHNKSVSYSGSGIFAKKSYTESTQYVQRAVLTPDEIMQLPAPKKKGDKIVKPGKMLVFAAGCPPIYGTQTLYFQDNIFKERVKIPAPEKSDILIDLIDTPPAAGKEELRMSA